MEQLTHLDNEDKPCMIDVSVKKDMLRIAEAYGHICLLDDTIEAISKNGISKGNVLLVAELAGIQATKKTSELIPLCHNIILSKVEVNAQLDTTGIKVTSKVISIGKTGVEMEALNAVTTSLLTVYDMCKGIDPNMMIDSVKLIEKTKTAINNG